MCEKRNLNIQMDIYANGGMKFYTCERVLNLSKSQFLQVKLKKKKFEWLGYKCFLYSDFKI